jgi:cell division septation protein DedD
MITIPPAEESDAPTPLGPTAAPEPDSPSRSDVRKKPIPLVWIPATLCVGLLIAAVYLGGRIVTAHSSAATPVKTKPSVTHAAPVVAQATPVVAKPEPVVAKAEPVVAKAEPVVPAAPVQAKAEPKPEARKPEAPKPAKPAAPQQAKSEPAPLEKVPGEPVPMIVPKGGERYIQVGALDLERTRRYIGHLREARLEPHVAPGPTPEMLRILIGPFADRDSLASIKTQLDRAGIDNFVREY